MLPLIVGIVWLGLYPAPVLRRMEPATRHYLEATAARGAARSVRRWRLAPAAAEDRR